jgi:Lipocalin-like domain
MKALHNFLAPMLASMAMFLLVSETAVAQTLKQEIVGAWQVVSTTNEKDGKKTEQFGRNPQGYFIFTADGQFSTGIIRPDRPKFASNNRETGTPEENKASVQGTIATFGTYTVNEANKSISVHIVGSNFPNWDGTNQKRTVEITGDNMKYTNPTSSVGGVVVIMLQRSK